MNLKHLTDRALLSDTKFLVQNERELTTQILHHLSEIDRRKLFAEMKCTSLFDYCTRILGYSHGSAQRRIQAARLLNVIPEIEDKIENGSLSLAAISMAVTFFKDEEIKKPEVKKDILGQIENLSSRDCERKLFNLSGKDIPAKETSKRLSSTTTKVSMILTDETLEKFKRIKGLVGKNMSNEELMSRMADATIRLIEKKKFKLLG